LFQASTPSLRIRKCSGSAIAPDFSHSYSIYQRSHHRGKANSRLRHSCKLKQLL
jgi:hypothetical protein